MLLVCFDTAWRGCVSVHRHAERGQGLCCGACFVSAIAMRVGSFGMFCLFALTLLGVDACQHAGSRKSGAVWCVPDLCSQHDVMFTTLQQCCGCVVCGSSVQSTCYHVFAATLPVTASHDDWCYTQKHVESRVVNVCVMLDPYGCILSVGLRGTAMTLQQSGVFAKTSVICEVHRQEMFCVCAQGYAGQQEGGGRVSSAAAHSCAVYLVGWEFSLV